MDLYFSHTYTELFLLSHYIEYKKDSFQLAGVWHPYQVNLIMISSSIFPYGFCHFNDYAVVAVFKHIILFLYSLCVDKIWFIFFYPPSIHLTKILPINLIFYSFFPVGLYSLTCFLSIIILQYLPLPCVHWPLLSY